MKIKLTLRSWMLILGLLVFLLAATGWGETNEPTRLYNLVASEMKKGTIGENLYNNDCDITNDITLVRGQANEPMLVGNLPDGHITNIVETLSVSDIIKMYAASGEICRVLGFHYWEWTEKIERWGWIVASEHLARKCRICGKVETKTEVWK